jgi:hypothetical protein
MAGGAFGLGDAMGYLTSQPQAAIQPQSVSLPQISVGPSGGGVPGITDAPTIPATPPLPQGSIQDRFVGALRDGGLTNPNGLGAVAAYAQHESRYAPGNITGSWSDPSQSGQPGTSGGILSWRADRLDNMRRFTAGAADPVAAQAQFLLQENPRLTQALQNASSPDEAHRLMADAWKFAGYQNDGSGEGAARLATTRNYVGRLGGGQSIGATYGDVNSGPSRAFVGSSNPGMSVGSTALQGGFGLSGIQAYGAPVVGQAGAAGVSSLINQPMQGSIAKGDWSAPTDQQSLLQKLMGNNSLSSLTGAAGALSKAGQQGQQKQGGGGMNLGQPYRPSPIGVQQAQSMFDPSKFYQMLSNADILTGRPIGAGPMPQTGGR